MHNSEIKKRIYELKKYTQQLKDSTSNSDNPLSDQKVKKLVLRAQEREKGSDGIKSNSKLSSAPFHFEYKPDPFELKFNAAKSANTCSQSAELAQIAALTEENADYEHQIKRINEELSELHKAILRAESQSWRENVPFLDYAAEVEVFITKMTIGKRDYDKIDYRMHRLIIQAEDLVLRRKNNHQVKQFSLINLKEVHYIEEKVMLIVFRGEEDQHSHIFVQFPSDADRNQLDIALFVNVKIMKEIDKVVNIPLNTTFNRLLESSTDRYMRINEEVASRVKSKSKANSKSVSVNSSEVKKINLQSLMAFKDGLNESRASVQSNKVQELNVFSDPLRTSDGRESRANTSKFNQNITQFFAHIDQEQGETESKFKITTQQELETDQKKRLRIIDHLTSGQYFIKYSKDAIKPHSKKIYINSNEGKLIWAESEDLQNMKSIDMKSIRDILYGEVGQGIKKFIKKEKIKPQNCCVISYCPQEGKTKVMEFQSRDSKIMKQFTQNLSTYLGK